MAAACLSGARTPIQRYFVKKRKEKKEKKASLKGKTVDLFLLDDFDLHWIWSKVLQGATRCYYYYVSLLCFGGLILFSIKDKERCWKWDFSLYGNLYGFCSRRISIREDEVGRLHLKNLTFYCVKNIEDALELLLLGDNNRYRFIRLLYTGWNGIIYMDIVVV